MKNKQIIKNFLFKKSLLIINDCIWEFENLRNKIFEYECIHYIARNKKSQEEDFVEICDEKAEKIVENN